jgi:hypothetical protein
MSSVKLEPFLHARMSSAACSNLYFELAKQKCRLVVNVNCANVLLAEIIMECAIGIRP